MGTCCKILNPLHIEAWDDLVMRHPEATFFHTQCWAKVLSETYGYQPMYLSVFSDDELRFLLPLMEIKSVITGTRGVSLPFTDYVQPLTASQEDTHWIWKELIQHAKKSGWQYIDLRGDIGGQTPETVFESFYQHDIRLEDDYDQMFSRFSTNHKRNIKKAIREGVEVEIRRDMRSIDQFYYLNSITRKRHGIPSQPYKFFKNIYEYACRENKAVVVTAKKGSDVVAGAIYFLFGNKSIYKYGASSKEDRQLRANNLVMWEAIKWLSNKNYDTLNLGRTKKSNSGLIRFKNGWAADQKTLSYYRYSIKDGVFVTKKNSHPSLGTYFFKTAPVAVSNFMGGVLYRHVG